MPKPEVAARLDAAVRVSPWRQRYDLYTNRLDPRGWNRWRRSPSGFAAHPSQAQAADRIMGALAVPTDRCLPGRATQHARLSSPARSTRCPPLAFQRWSVGLRPTIRRWSCPQWREIAKKLTAALGRRRRTPAVKHQIAAALVQVFRTTDARASAWAFSAGNWPKARSSSETNYTYQLFEALVGQPWTAELENEAFALLVHLSGSPEPAERLRVAGQRPASSDRHDGRGRYDSSRMAQVEHPENLTRTELTPEAAGEPAGGSGRICRAAGRSPPPTARGTRPVARRRASVPRRPARPPARQGRGRLLGGCSAREPRQVRRGRCCAEPRCCSTPSCGSVTC